MVVDHLRRWGRRRGRVVMLHNDALFSRRRIRYDDSFGLLVLLILVMLFVKLSILASVAAPDDQQDDNDQSCFVWEMKSNVWKNSFQMIIFQLENGASSMAKTSE